VHLWKTEQQLRDCKYFVTKTSACGGDMYYDPGRHHGEQQALSNEAERKLLLDSMEAVAQPRSERETQRVMDGLLREFLRRKPLIP
jgi:hypothetical protein